MIRLPASMGRAVTLTFLGANRQVTGSRYLLDTGDARVLVDCGMFQERDLLHRNWEPSPGPPSSIDHLLLTHAHLDHCGLIPCFVRDGYRGPVHTTQPSIELARIVLEDSARIQEEDAAYKRRRHQREGRTGPHPEIPLYTVADAEAALGRFVRIAYNRRLALDGNVEVMYRDAGHILGAASLEVRLDIGGRTRRLVFSADIGQGGRPLIHDPVRPRAADWVILESTYGDRSRDVREDVTDALARIVNDTVQRGGNIIIPTFAIDRAQAIMFHLGELVRAERIPRLTIFLDSPMAVDVTGVYKRYRHLLDERTQKLVEAGDHPFQFAGLHFVRSKTESLAINSIRGSCIVMAGSGMCTGGRVKHHLRQNIERPESTIVFTGFQAVGTLGRHIVDGDREVRIHGGRYTVRARIERIEGMSAHADRDGLLRWLGGLKTPPQRVYLTHGEGTACDSLAGQIQQQLGWDATVPEYGTTIELG